MGFYLYSEYIINDIADVFYVDLLQNYPSDDDLANWATFKQYLLRNPLYKKRRLSQIPEIQTRDQLEEGIEVFTELISRYPGNNDFRHFKMQLLNDYPHFYEDVNEPLRELFITLMDLLVHNQSEGLGNVEEKVLSYYFSGYHSDDYFSRYSLDESFEEVSVKLSVDTKNHILKEMSRRLEALPEQENLRKLSEQLEKHFRK